MNAKKLTVTLGLAFAFLAMQTPKFAAADASTRGEATGGVYGASYDRPLAQSQAVLTNDTGPRAPMSLEFGSNGFLGPFYRHN